ncbi:KIR protein [Plasmodium coatneyi]|uniref:KIR protein n=1 Tax=Plasmodium coatneyi TaxID=208452 RepID=A0A1B1DSH8_9APIC|nr:KIR protein [Plasmodium coatneyi]ANQ05746.1 KIR protein [Plasmodium coatneyi]
MQDSNLSNDDRCGFLFNWIVDKIKNELEEGRYLQATKDIYKLLQEIGSEWRCNNIYNGMGKPLFEESRELFDFDYNLKTLQQQKPSGGNTQSCWPQYNAHWTNAKKEYEKMGAHCDVDQSCLAFRKKYDHYFAKNGGEPPKLPCAAMSKEEKKKEEEDPEEQSDDDLVDIDLPEEEEDGLPGEPGVLGVNKLKELPSYTDFYSKFNDGSTSCENSTTWFKQMKVKLEDDEDTKKYAEQVVKAVCYLYEMKDNPPNSNKEYCNFFYFSVGNMLLKELKGKGKSFNAAMEKIKTAVECSTSDHGCYFTCNNGKHSKFFPQRKLLYEYLKDKNTIQQQIKGGGGTTPCTQKYFTYLEKINAAYMTIYAQRNGQQWNHICKEFGEIFDQGVGKLSEVENLKCLVVTTPEHEERTATSGSSPSEGSNSATNKITPIVMSIIGIVGLPVTTFFLYKVSNNYNNYNYNYHYTYPQQMHLLYIMNNNHHLKEEQIIEGDNNNRDNVSEDKEPI